MSRTKVPGHKPPRRSKNITRNYVKQFIASIMSMMRKTLKKKTDGGSHITFRLIIIIIIMNTGNK